MSYKIYIDTGAGYVRFYPDIEDVTIKRVRQTGMLFSVDTINGDFVFNGAEAITLRTLLNTTNYLPIKVDNAYETLIIAKLSLLGNYDMLNQTAKLGCINSDRHAKLMTSWNTRYEIKSNELPKYNVVITADTTYDRSGYMLINELIPMLVGKIDDTILFDANSLVVWQTIDSMYPVYMNTMQNFNKALTDNPITDSLSLNDVLYFWIEQCKFIWYIDEDNYFRLDLRSNYNIVIGSNPTLNNYLAVNWSKDKKEFTYDNETRYSKLIRTFINTDNEYFKGKDIIIENLDETIPTKTINTAQYITDLYDANVNNAKYLELNNYFSFACGFSAYTGISKLDYRYRNLTPNFALKNCGYDKVGDFYIFINFSYTEPAYVFIPLKMFPSGSDFKPYSGHIIKTYFNVYSAVSDGYILPTSVKSAFSCNDDINNSNDTDLLDILSYPAEWRGTGSVQLFDLDYISDGNSNDFPLGIGLKIEGSYLCGIKVQMDSAIIGFPLAEYGNQLTSKNFDGVTGNPIKLNNRLSIAELDETFQKVLQPNTPAIINGVSTAVTVEKKFITNDIIFPATDQNLINFNELVTTDLGDIEPIEFEVKLNGEMARLKGKF